MKKDLRFFGTISIKSFVRSFRSSLLAITFLCENENLILLSNRSVISEAENRATIRKENTNNVDSTLFTLLILNR